MRNCALRFTLGLAAALGAAVAHGGGIVATVTDQHGKPIADAVVVAVAADAASKPASRPRDDAILQVDKEFVPRVTAVQVGTAIAFPNNDTVRHHVYSFSPPKRFELPLYSGVPAQPIVFDKPGVVVLGCNIHDWMVAYVYVSESPHFARTGPTGKASIGELPPRRYVVRVWHPGLEVDEASTRRTLDVTAAGPAEVAWTLTLKPEVVVRRAPSLRQAGRY